MALLEKGRIQTEKDLNPKDMGYSQMAQEKNENISRTEVQPVETKFRMTFNFQVVPFINLTVIHFKPSIGALKYLSGSSRKIKAILLACFSVSVLFRQ